jgi:hypothetical protein
MRVHLAPVAAAGGGGCAQFWLSWLSGALPREGRDGTDGLWLGGKPDQLNWGPTPPGGCSTVMAAALSRPAEWALPFASWTLDRLVACLGEKGVGMKRSQVSEGLLAQGSAKLRAR